MDHATLFWDAEEKNAARLSSQVRVLTTLGVALIAAVGLRLSLSYSDQIANTRPLPLVAWLSTTLVLVVIVAILPRKALSVLALVSLDAAVWLWGEPTEYLHSVMTGALFGVLICFFVFLIIAMYQVLMPITPRTPVAIVGKTASSADAEAPEPAASTRLFTLALAGPLDWLRRQFKGDGAAPDTSSARFALSRNSIIYASNVLTQGQWSVFHRQYRAALDLQARNVDFRDRIRAAQRCLCSAFILGMATLALLIQAEISAPPDPTDETVDPELANNVEVKHD